MGSEQTTGGAPSEYAQLAERYGLQPQVGRPPFWGYLKDLWKSRNFIWTLATTRSYARHENTYLGQLWSILTPLLYAGVYLLIFGVVLGTRGGITNFPAFLVVGVFIFQFCTAALSHGASAVTGNLAMIRSLQFPRAVLPISVVVTEFLTTLPALVVMFVVVSLTGERPSWEWLLVVPAFAVIMIFNAGMSLLAARLVSQYRDVKNIIPFIVQFLRYMSGLFFSISHYTENLPALGTLLQYQPYALSLELIRGSLLGEFSVSSTEILVMCGWAVLAAVGGIVYFWRREGKYGVE